MAVFTVRIYLSNHCDPDHRTKLNFLGCEANKNYLVRTTSYIGETQVHKQDLHGV